MSHSSPRLSTAALAAIAIGLGAAVSAGWIYGNGLHYGNGEAAQNQVAIVGGECETKAKTLAELKPLARGEVAAMAIREEATPLPALSFVDTDGAQKTLSDYRGQVLLVNLWATWCAPCRAEMPALSKLQADLGGAGFSVMPINIDTGDVAKPQAFLAEIGVDNLGLHRDPSMDVFNTMKKQGLAFGLPVTLLVGADGCLMGAMNGPAEWAGADAHDLVKAAIAAQTPVPAGS
ncbi:thiol-disulfide isomerase/thioredoxin [Hoeflea marina]|uniref:Thiol-disulfide isomerase/thioredoxin n=1 Tax=Hoeflea marina TaxID=274592 RepID=A0A317PGT0_9HYPH|nr:TlpA disulfide reductase family protein [Hoeflea marina]PWV98081.1 thiol-disulfide isomerase/thioredoxin [Hoeflea marina]